MFNKKPCKGSERFTCDVGIINLFLVDLGCMFCGSPDYTSPQKLPNPDQKDEHQGIQFLQVINSLPKLSFFFLYLYWHFTKKIRCFFLSQPTSHFWCKRPWLAPILLQDGGWGQLVTSEAVEECACRFAFERYSEIAGLKHVMLLDQKLLVVPFLICGYRIQTQRAGTILWVKSSKMWVICVLVNEDGDDEPLRC